MKTKLRDFEFDQIPARYIQLTCLTAVAVYWALTTIFGIYIYEDFRNLIMLQINLAGMVYFGVTIRTHLSRTARNTILLGLCFCAWPLFMQLRDLQYVISTWHPEARFPNGVFLCEYLMLLPYACAADEKEKVTGLKVFGWFVILATAVLTVWGLPFGENLIPVNLRDTYRWNGMRMCIIWNANMLAVVYMAGIAFCLMFICQIRNIVAKLALGGLACLEFIAMTLTDCRAVVLMTACLLGGTVFVLINRGGAKRFIAALLAAVVVLGISYKTSAYIYQVHTDRFIAATLEKAAAQKEEAESEAEETAVPAEDAEENSGEEEIEEYYETELQAQYYEDERQYRESTEHLFAFGGRTMIWKETLKLLKENPRVLLVGMRSIEDTIPYYDDYAAHAHNAWLNILMWLGLIGLGFALYLTWITAKNAFSLIFLKQSETYQKIIAILLIAILISEFFEPQLFFVMYPDNFTNMIYLLCLGYTIYWEKNAQPLAKKKREIPEA